MRYFEDPCAIIESLLMRILDGEERVEYEVK
jgi:hypothetical protein